MSIDAKFQDALVRVKRLPNQSNQSLLDLYSLYKQATDGDVSGKRPGMLDMKGRAKYDAWEKRKGMTKDQAKEAYVALVDRLGG